MNFFNQILKHPKKFEKEFDKNISKKDLEHAYQAGKQGVKADKRGEKVGFYTLPHTFSDKSSHTYNVEP